MKNILLCICAFFACAFTVNAQQEKGIIGSSNWLNNWTEFKPGKIEYGDATQILAGSITENTKLVKKEIYILQGNVYVTNKAVLTIEPGTVIIGDGDSRGTLIITKGSQIIAEGTETDPIVFTSNRSTKKAGDWGGVIVLGDAPISKFGSYSAINYDLDSSLTTYGGQNPASSSGVMKFVRIEYAGKKVRGSLEGFNALLLGGIGNKTILENIQVSYAASDSFEVLGGEPVLSKMVSYKASGVDFKFAYGAQAKIDNSLAIRSSYLSTSGAHGLDVISYVKKEEVDFTKKQTSVTATNLTLANDSDNIEQDIKAGLVKEGVYVGDNATLVLRKSVLSGFSPAIVLDSKIEVNEKNLKRVRIEEMYFNFCNGNIFSEGSADNEDLESYYGNSLFFNLYSKTPNLETFNDFANPKRPDFRLALSKFTAATSK